MLTIFELLLGFLLIGGGFSYYALAERGGAARVSKASTRPTRLAVPILLIGLGATLVAAWVLGIDLLAY